MYNISIFLICLCLIGQTYYQSASQTINEDWKDTAAYVFGAGGVSCSLIGLFITTPALGIGLCIIGVSCALTGGIIAIWDKFDISEGN